jgi:cobalt-zinc-cadmium efflux system outer membrane protein
MTVKNLLSALFWFHGLLLVPWMTTAETDPSRVPLGSGFDSYTAPEETGSEGDARSVAQEPTGELSLRDAIAAALLRNPGLAVFSWEVRVREASAVQAAALPNPYLSVEVENVGGEGDRNGFEQTEATFLLSQLIELGGKRSKRRHLAELQGELAQWDYETARLRVLTGTTKAFVATLAGQERLSLAEEVERLARTAVGSLSKRVKSGAGSPAEKVRVEVVLLAAELERMEVERELAANRIALSATWAGTPRFSTLRGALSNDVTAPPPLAELERRIGSNPDLARWSTALEEREALLSLVRSGRVPDPTIGLGGRYFGDTKDGAFVFGLSVPLPVFDQKQAGVLEATRSLSKARAEKAAAELAIRESLALRYQELVSAFERAAVLRERTLRTAERAFAHTRDGYHQGLFHYIDVLDAQRTLFELRTQLVEALATYHQARTDIERLTATPINYHSAAGEER